MFVLQSVLRTSNSGSRIHELAVVYWVERYASTLPSDDYRRIQVSSWLWRVSARVKYSNHSATSQSGELYFMFEDIDMQEALCASFCNYKE